MPPAGWSPSKCSYLNPFDYLRQLAPQPNVQPHSQQYFGFLDSRLSKKQNNWYKNYANEDVADSNGLAYWLNNMNQNFAHPGNERSGNQQDKRRFEPGPTGLNIGVGTMSNLISSVIATWVILIRISPR
ncbi:hypothetical protein FJZ31_15170 [Candidatus Poribacteria bacterium]|nr:hypothetical protein [Candidatus Poribacteria bacterium]